MVPMAIDPEIIHKIAAYAVTQHPVWTGHLLDYVSDLADAATYSAFAIRHIDHGEGEMLQFVADFRTGPAAEQTAASLEVASALVATIEGSLERNPVLVGAIEDLLIAEVFHRCKWDEVESRHPETLEWLRRSAG
jgi:hypothetical protein